MNKNKQIFQLFRQWRLIAAAIFIATTTVILALDPPALDAASNSNLTQTINAGTLATDIKDASRVTVASPSVAMSAAAFAFTCLTGGSAPTGTFGTNTQRIYVENPGAANNGWTLTLAATSGVTTLWQNGGATENYDFNDTGGSGCTDGADADSKGGQLTVDPSVSTLTADCSSCATTNITKGSSTAYNQGTTDSVTLLTAAAASDNVGRWYLTGVGLSQTIPSDQTPDAYTINFTLTITAS
ncbi:hypothetical protein H0V99_01780 [Candidatus Saccharibacteria bacterium]|nr:hypothetical protein [Candidatus Saccharibacteria bacterium]